MFSSASPDGRALIVANASASRIGDRSRRARLLAAVSASVAERTGRPPRLIEVAGASTLETAIRAARDSGSPLVVVVGGDGTVRAAARVLAGSGIPIGIVPAGTGNLLASALRIPRALGAAAAALATLPVRTIDLGEVAIHRDRRPVGSGDPRERFAVACGAGFDAAVMAATSRDAKRRLGVAAYFAAAARLLDQLRPVQFRIDVDGVAVETDGVAALVANCGDLVPGLLRPRMPIDPADGLLELLVVRSGGAIGGARATLELLTQRAPRVTGVLSGRSLRIRGHRISVVPDPPVALQVDGDPYPAGWFVANVVPGDLHVLAPVGVAVPSSGLAG